MERNVELTEKLKSQIEEKLQFRLGFSNIGTAPKEMYYQATVMVLNGILLERRRTFWAKKSGAQKKQVYYLSMEFLLGRSLKNTLFNLDMIKPMADALSSFGVSLESLYDYEPDAGLGNGGLGRLAACYLDALATEEYLATGYCLLYEFGMFRQQIFDGWQTEIPDEWLPGGGVWLTTRPGFTVEVRFGGFVDEYWENGRHFVKHKGFLPVTAEPYDISIPGYQSEGVSVLRVWKAHTPSGMDMDSFNRGDYVAAFEQRSMGEAITKVLYPNDNHEEGKLLRLRQQYFLCAASIADICNRHMSVYHSFDHFAQKNAIHINDTHPTLAIPELMRFFLDDCGFDWDYAWNIVKNTFAYTNHTVMREALECWDQTLFKSLLPRIYFIICEINRRFCAELYQKGHSSEEVAEMAILDTDQIRMANLAVVGSHSVNGVSRLHSEIIKKDVFRHFYEDQPDRFTNVTNGIASRRWLLQSNPSLTTLVRQALNPHFGKHFSELEQLLRYQDDPAFLEQLARSKRENKGRFAQHIEKTTGAVLDPESIFDVQVKRMHEYKRQQMNALEIIATYQALQENPNADFVPRTYIFGGKAAPGYFMAKQVIRLIWAIGEKLKKDPQLRKKMRVLFLEEYNVSTSEILMPAADLSEQISLAGTEASGTSNMKLMLNGAITLGTLDGANVEIEEQVGEEHILIFGKKAQEVERLRQEGYRPQKIYEENPIIRRAVDALLHDFGSETFPEIHSMLIQSDYYMTLADFEAYQLARQKSGKLYQNQPVWRKMSLYNIAKSGYFCADRAVEEYAARIWHLDR